MIFKRIHLGITSFNKETLDDLQMTLRDSFGKATAQKSTGIFGMSIFPARIAEKGLMLQPTRRLVVTSRLKQQSAPLLRQ